MFGKNISHKAFINFKLSQLEIFKSQDYVEENKEKLFNMYDIKF